MSSSDRSSRPKRDKSLAAFGRAVRYLFPYWRIVAVSISCAIFVGLATAGGITTMLPIMRVLLNGDTLAGWADRQVVGQRLKVTFADDNVDLRLVKVDSDLDEPANVVGRSGLKAGDAIAPADEPTAKPAVTLARLADPDLAAITLVNQAGKPFALTITIN